MPSSCSSIQRCRSHRPARMTSTRIATPTPASTKAKPRPAKALSRLAANELTEHLPIALEREEPVCVFFRIPATQPAHLLEIPLAVVCRADRLREQLRPPRRNNDATADALYELRRLALGLRCRDHRPPRGEDAGEAARHDEPRNPPPQSDEVHVGGRQRHREHVAFLV